MIREKKNQRYVLEFAYNGKNYFGYQIQPNQVSVQQELEKVLSTLLRSEVNITGAGRTDTGVHARKMYAHFDFEYALPDDFLRRINSFLPPDIAIFKVGKADADFHARFDAVYRTYQYHISLQKDPFTQFSAWQFHKKPLNVNLMNQAAKILFDYHDFESFSKVGGDNKTTLCEIYKADWSQADQLLTLTISANRFLRNMVRAIVGTLVEVGVGKILPVDLRSIIEAKDRSRAGSSAPAHGLFLVDVGYQKPIEWLR